MTESSHRQGVKKENTKKYTAWPLIAKETIFSFLVGGMPIILSYYALGIQIAENVTKSLMPDKHLLIIWGVIAALAFLLLFFGKKNLPSKTHHFLHEMATTGLGLSRIISGILIGFPLLAILEGEFDRKVLLIFIYGLTSLFETLVISYGLDKINPKYQTSIIDHPQQ